MVIVNVMMHYRNIIYTFVRDYKLTVQNKIYYFWDGGEIG